MLLSNLCLLLLVGVSTQDPINYFEFAAKGKTTSSKLTATKAKTTAKVKTASKTISSSSTVSELESVGDAEYFVESIYTSDNTVYTTFIPYTNGIPVTPVSVNYKRELTTTLPASEITQPLGDPLVLSPTLIVNGNTTSTSLVPTILTITYNVSSSSIEGSTITSSTELHSEAVGDPLYFIPSTIVQNNFTFTTYIPYTDGVPVTPYYPVPSSIPY